MAFSMQLLRALKPSNLGASTCLRQTRHFTMRELQFDKNGQPTEVLQLKTLQAPDNLPPHYIVVAMRATPINPADVNQVQGVYPIKPFEPGVSGSEGYGVVEKIGPDVHRVAVGDTVVPSRVPLGTWRSHLVCDQGDVSKIDDPKGLSDDCLAMLMANPATAYRMLHDFVALKPGDWVIQNAAESALGHNVVQICKLRKWKTINIIYDRKDDKQNAALKQELLDLGADHVFTDTEMYHKAVKKLLKSGDIGAPRLALNGVGGESSQYLAGTLVPQGVMVTYGGMSKHAVHCPTIPLIFKDIKLSGFCMAYWYQQFKDTPEKKQMINELTTWMRNGQLLPAPNEHKPVAAWKDAFAVAESGFGKKQILIW